MKKRTDNLMRSAERLALIESIRKRNQVHHNAALIIVCFVIGSVVSAGVLYAIRMMQVGF